MRVLVIGGTLFIGREIVRRLLARGHDVTVLHRRAEHDLGPEVRNLQADRGDTAKVSALLRAERFEGVVDVAYDWQKGTTAADVEAAARSCGDALERYVFISSIAAYGPGLGHRESDELVPDDDPRAYAGNKAATERMLFRLHEAHGFPAVTFRPPYVHGPRQPFYREQFFWDRLLDGRPILLPDGGAAPMQWVYVGDLAEACVRALEVPEAAGEAFNVAHEATTQRRFVETMARVAGVEPALVPVSKEKIRAAGGEVSGAKLYFGEALDMPPITEVVEKAPRVLGVAPTSFEHALRESFAWYRGQPRRPRDYAFEDSLTARV
ncbi:MAG TPA: NAD-dependent epimerase/dehydratase family protein [Gammaproteobacteria bacterium]|nr:NAD-dependent epimerase/dehydratase family protein [Gammaproteobacteria bacterium]